MPQMGSEQLRQSRVDEQNAIPLAAPILWRWPWGGGVMADRRHKAAFVLMPFDADLKWVYDDLIKPGFEPAGYTVRRADDINSQQNILKDIVTGDSSG